MEKIIITSFFMFLSFLCTVTQAADKVVVIPLGGTNVYIDPRNIVSAYILTPSSGDPVKAFDVPSSKHFVLTDIIGNGTTTIYEGATTKISVQVGNSNSYGVYPNPITISSGIVFKPGSEIKISCHNYYSSSGYYPCSITISGYYY